MIEEIFRGLHNPEFVDKVLYHMKEDAGGLGNYTVALFGDHGLWSAVQLALLGPAARGRLQHPNVLLAAPIMA